MENLFKEAPQDAESTNGDLEVETERRGPLRISSQVSPAGICATPGSDSLEMDDDSTPRGKKNNHRKVKLERTPPRLLWKGNPASTSLQMDDESTPRGRGGKSGLWTIEEGNVSDLDFENLLRGEKTPTRNTILNDDTYIGRSSSFSARYHMAREY